MRPSPCKAAPSFERNSLKELNEWVTVVKSQHHSLTSSAGPPALSSGKRPKMKSRESASSAPCPSPCSIPPLKRCLPSSKPELERDENVRVQCPRPCTPHPARHTPLFENG